MDAFLLLAQAAEQSSEEAASSPSAWESVRTWFESLPAWSPLAGAAVLLAVGLWLLVPPSCKWRRVGGALLVAAAVAILLSQAPMLAGIVAPALFWILAAIAVAPAVAAISVKDPVYSALWFALCLLGVAGLFLYQGALFLGIATVAVYAGAIVVTFLFVLMLAQPEGHAFYDRMGWGRFSTGVACLATAAFVAVLVYSYSEIDSDTRKVASVLELHTDAQGEPLVAPEELRRVSLYHAPDRLELLLSGERLSEIETARVRASLVEQYEGIYEDLQVELKYGVADRDVLAPNHVAHLGDQLFGPHLIAVEIAGALLLAALVGAVAIATRGDDAPVEAGLEKEGGTA